MASETVASIRPDFDKIEFNKTVWEIPRRYSNLQPVGSGAYGQVWYVYLSNISLVYTNSCMLKNNYQFCFIGIQITLTLCTHILTYLWLFGSI